MRVIAGSARGRPLKAPPGRDVRPTTDRVREAMFSSLGDEVVGARVLDLFAGTGALGIEALSRGAVSATFVEAQASVVPVLRANLERAGVADRAHVVRTTAATFAGAAAGATAAGEAFDLIFCDPPYDVPFAGILDVLATLYRSAATAPAATVVVERDKRDAALAGDVDGRGMLVEARRRSYGDTTLVYLHFDEEATT